VFCRKAIEQTTKEPGELDILISMVTGGGLTAALLFIAAAAVFC